MTERILSKYDREFVKQRFAQEFGPMLEPNELNLPDEVRESLFAIWPGNNIPVYPAFQFNDDRTPNRLFLKVIDIVSESGKFYSPKLICDKLFKEEKGVRGIDLIRQGKKKRALAWAKNFDNIKLTMF